MPGHLRHRGGGWWRFQRWGTACGAGGMASEGGEEVLWRPSAAEEVALLSQAGWGCDGVNLGRGGDIDGGKVGGVVRVRTIKNRSCIVLGLAQVGDDKAKVGTMGSNFSSLSRENSG